MVLLPEIAPRRYGSLKRLVQRYLIAAIGFVVAAVWLGVALSSGLECLLAFLLTLVVVTAVQRRQRVVAHGGHPHRTAGCPATLAVPVRAQAPGHPPSSCPSEAEASHQRMKP